jgi:hypothetical protein
MQLAQFVSPVTAQCEPRTNLDFAKLVEKRDKRQGIAYTASSKK